MHRDLLVKQLGSLLFVRQSKEPVWGCFLETQSNSAQGKHENLLLGRNSSFSASICNLRFELVYWFEHGKLAREEGQLIRTVSSEGPVELFVPSIRSNTKWRKRN
jgi:hypothetical protein